MFHSRSDSFASTSTPAGRRPSLRLTMSPSPSAAEPSSSFVARRRSWVLAMDKSRRERREAASNATTYGTDEFAAHELGLPSDAFDNDALRRPALRLRPQRRDSTRMCLACGRPVCETPLRNVSYPSNDGVHCSCRLRCNSDDEVLRAENASESFFLSPATSDRFVLELPNDTNAASWANEDMQSSSDEEALPNEQPSSGQLVFRRKPAFRKPGLLQPKTVHRCHSDPLTSPTPAVPASLTDEVTSSPEPAIAFLPAPPIYNEEITETVNLSLRPAEPSMELVQPGLDEPISESNQKKPLPGLENAVSSSVAWAPETTFESATKRSLKPRPRNGPSSEDNNQVPLLPIDTPENVKPTLTVKSIPNLLQPEISPPAGFDIYVTPTQPRRKYTGDIPVLNIPSQDVEMEVATPTAKSTA